MRRFSPQCDAARGACVFSFIEEYSDTFWSSLGCTLNGQVEVTRLADGAIDWAWYDPVAPLVPLFRYTLLRQGQPGEALSTLSYSYSYPNGAPTGCCGGYYVDLSRTVLNDGVVPTSIGRDNGVEWQSTGRPLDHRPLLQLQGSAAVPLAVTFESA